MRYEIASEQRMNPRRKMSGAIVWRMRTCGSLETGWLLECSDSGLAFAWRGEKAPRVDTLIEIGSDDDSGLRRPTHGVIRRVQNVHSDLKLFGIETIRLTPFPPASIAAAAEAEVESKWQQQALALAA